MQANTIAVETNIARRGGQTSPVMTCSLESVRNARHETTRCCAPDDNNVNALAEPGCHLARRTRCVARCMCTCVPCAKCDSVLTLFQNTGQECAAFEWAARTKHTKQTLHANQDHRSLVVRRARRR